MKDWFMVDGVKCHFEQYFSYIMVVSFIDGGNHRTQRNHWPVAGHWQTLSHNVVHLTLQGLKIPQVRRGQFSDSLIEENSKTCSDRERFLLNGPMAPSSKFQWAIQKINGPYHKPNGPFFTCIFRFWKLCNRLSSNTAIDKTTDHGNDINPGIDPESETQSESQMSESNNKTTETESERSELLRWQMSVK
jgi:hypothetical protein